MSIQIQRPRKLSIDERLARNNKERGLKPMPLEVDLLLKRIKDGGHSGQFLADAFISAYRTNRPFKHSLGELNKLDNEGFRLFHEILHIRFIPGWRDAILDDIEDEILAIQDAQS